MNRSMQLNDVRPDSDALFTVANLADSRTTDDTDDFVPVPSKSDNGHYDLVLEALPISVANILDDPWLESSPTLTQLPGANFERDQGLGLRGVSAASIAELAECMAIKENLAALQVVAEESAQAAADLDMELF